MSAVSIYLILGPVGAGRREVLADLIANGLDATARPLLLAAATETAVGAGAAPTTAADERLAGIASLARGTWSLVDGRVEAILPGEATHVFLLADGRANPVDQLEAWRAWLPSTGGELARIITIVHCQLGVEHPEVLRWYDACVHFSDVVLLNRRDGVPNKWISDFIARYRKQHYPCLIELVKRGEVANPALILEPEARRVSQLFDEIEPFTVAVVSAVDVDDDEDAAEDGDESVVEEDGVPVDPYVERLAGSGRRAKEIPDIARYL